ncbi:MAG TPA: SRPBCC domain-containing protein [Acidimicrobiales bacterium]|nr:SRPBCC domain-containing protein [Acidimicrobiales bacterium]
MSNLGEVTITRIYDAPRELVFECMTTPEHLTHFWGPVGSSTPIDNITVDLRPGGVFKTIMVDDATGAEYTMHGVFVEIDPPEKLVWSEADVEGGMTTSATFVDLGDGRTECTTHQTNVPEMYRTPEAQAGMQSSLDRFATYVAGLAQRSAS